jgi:hypothetical protein
MFSISAESHRFEEMPDHEVANCVLVGRKWPGRCRRPNRHAGYLDWHLGDTGDLFQIRGQQRRMKSGTKVEHLREHASLFEALHRGGDGVLFTADDRLVRAVIMRNDHALDSGDCVPREVDAAAEGGKQATR